MKITVRFSAKSLVGANAGIDLDASSDRYRDALMAAITADYPRAQVDVARDDTATLVVSADGDREVERSVTDLAWVVRQCAPWSVPAR